MTAKDFIHDIVKNALVKDGWKITDDPLTLEYEDAQLFVDLGAERVIAAERENEKIAVEIKSFVGQSVIHDMKLALGQYMMYLSFLEAVEPQRMLFLAITDIAYLTIFQRKSIQHLVNDYQLSFIVVDTEREEIIKWEQK